MATAHTMPNMNGRSFLLPPDQLNVQGRGLSPQPTHDASMASLASSTRSSFSDDDGEGTHQSEEYTVLDGVREMNHILVRQIETLRLKIQVDEKNSNSEKSKLKEDKEREIQQRESEIEDLKDSLTNRDERIHGLVKAGHEKDRTIQTKSEEIETLKDLVRQSEKYAQKLQKQINRVVSDKDRLEEDPLYKKQNEEMMKLTEELETLRERLASMEEELHRAMEIIDSQNKKMKSILDEKSLIHAKFREELDRVSRAMRQEVERMREVMRQNYEEMRNLREENKQMHDDVRDIKEMLQASRMSGGHQSDQHQYESITGLPRPITANNRQIYGQSTNLTARGPGSMMGGNIAHTPSVRHQRSLASRGTDSSKRFQAIGRENTQMISKRGRSSFRSPHHHPNPYESSSPPATHNTPSHQRSNVRSSMDTSRSHSSPDTSARPVDNHTSSNQRLHSDHTSHPHSITQHAAKDGVDSAKNFPPICSIKETTNVSGRKSASKPAPKSAIRRGSAVRK